MTPAALGARAIPKWATLAAIALGYFVAAKASLVFAISPGYATAVWPPSGIALAALLMCGLRAWPGVWLGAALTNYSIDLSVPAALGIATGNTLEGVSAAWLVGHLTDRRTEFRHPEQVFLFAMIAAATSVVAATVGVSSLHLAGAVVAEGLLGNWYTWWQGDSTGMLLVTPCILAWARGSSGEQARAGPLELVLFGTLLIAMLLAVFARDSLAHDARPLAFLAVPFFVWAACRFTERAVTLTVLAANGWAIWCTVNGLGPFQAAATGEALLMLQAFTSTGSLVALVLWALLRRNADALERLRVSHSAFEQDMWARVRELHGQLESQVAAQGPPPNLFSMLRAHAARIELEHGVAIEVVGGNLTHGLSTRTFRTLFWIAQEALHNIVRHARASRAVVELESESGLATLTVRDDGVGFAPESVPRRGDGILLMRARAQAAGGKLRIHSAPGKGTTLRVTAKS